MNHVIPTGAFGGRGPVLAARAAGIGTRRLQRRRALGLMRICAVLTITGLESLGIISALALGADAPSEPRTWHAGVAVVKITPQRPLWMAGYSSRDRPAEGTLTDLYAKALVLEDGYGQRAALVTMDLIGIDRGLSAAVCQQLMTRYELAREQIVLSTSHTHTGPVVARNLRAMHFALLDETQQLLVDGYARQLEESLLAAVDQAWQRMRPVQLARGCGRATFAVNRRNNPEAEVPQRRVANQLVGPFDHDVPVLSIRTPAGELVAVVFGYACHATVLADYKWSGDYPGFAQRELEMRHPGAVALFWAGCGGDQNPLPRRTVALAQEYGRQLASAVDAVLATEPVRIEPRIQTSYHEIDLPLAPIPDRTQWELEVLSENRYVAARAQYYLAQRNAGHPVATTYPYPVGLWQLGDSVRWVFLGGEVVVDYALRLKERFGSDATWIAAYTNDVMAYIPSRRVLREGGYEGGGAMVYYGLPAPWSEAVEQLICEEVERQVTGRSSAALLPRRVNSSSSSSSYSNSGWFFRGQGRRTSATGWHAVFCSVGVNATSRDAPITR